MKLQLTLVTDDNESLKLPDLDVLSVGIINSFEPFFRETKITIETEYNEIDVLFEDDEIQLYNNVVKKLTANKNEFTL